MTNMSFIERIIDSRSSKELLESSKIFGASETFFFGTSAIVQSNDFQCRVIVFDYLYDIY